MQCDTPSYVSQIYKLEERQTQQARREAGCSLDGFKRHKMAKVALGGDVAFTEYPFTLAAKFVESELGGTTPSAPSDGTAPSARLRVSWGSGRSYAPRSAA